VEQRRVTIAKCRERIENLKRQQADIATTVAELSSFVQLLVDRERAEGRNPDGSGPEWQWPDRFCIDRNDAVRASHPRG
ncbi:hypothetical protein ABTN35_20980, partial [Acinetobacter baumannii]